MAQSTIRVYGVCINERKEVLISDEMYRGQSFTKFPGGGLEYGEGTIDCLKREFLEEFNLEIAVGRLFYLTDFFQSSAFDSKTQVISVYYEVLVKTQQIDTVIKHGTTIEKLRWINLDELQEGDLTFPIDQHVCAMILESR